MLTIIQINPYSLIKCFMMVFPKIGERLRPSLAKLVVYCSLVALEQGHALVHAPHWCLPVINLHRLT